MIDLNKYETLRCPKCNCQFLHQTQTRSFFREKEDKTTQITTCTTGKTETKFETETRHENETNPSPRRDATQIGFVCEQCETVSYLTFVQHKGETYTGWE